MKFVLVLSSLWSLVSAATGTCPYVVRNTYNLCRHQSHGLDIMGPVLNSTVMVVESEWLPGGQDQKMVCEKVKDSFNRNNLEKGSYAVLSQPLPVTERKPKKDIDSTKYMYGCELNVKNYFFKMQSSPACGVAGWNVGSINEMDIPNLRSGNVSCLACEQKRDSSIEEYVQCLGGVLRRIKSVGLEVLTEAQIGHLRKAVLELQAQAQMVRIGNLGTPNQVAPFIEFLNNSEQKSK